MNRVRRVAAAALATPLLTAGALVAGATPAAADAGITSPSNGETVTGSTLTVTAETDGPGRLYLDYKGDGEDAERVDEGSGTLSYQVSTHDIRNGTYDLVVQEDGLLDLIGADEDDATFTVQAPPAQPSGVSAAGTSSREVEVSWDKGEEPDLASYRVSAGGASEHLSVSEACAGGDCSATLAVPAGAAGGDITASVEALRYTAGPGSDVIDSAAASDSVNLPGGGYGTHAANSSSSGTLPSGLGRGGLPSPSLQPLANDKLLRLPPIGPRNGTAAGVPQPRLPSAQGSSQDKVASPRTEPASALEATQWWKTIAVGLVLLLIAAHLGAWSWRTRPIRGGTGGATALATTLRAGRGMRVLLASRRSRQSYHGRRRRDR